MPISEQFIKYAFVGIVSNLVLFGIYLIFTTFGLAPKLAMTGLYALGVLQTFVFNRSWTFRYRGSAPKSLWKYVLAYLSGYFVNLAILYVFVDRLGFYHAYVQGAVVPALAVYLFMLQKYVVFRPASVDNLGSDPSDLP